MSAKSVTADHADPSVIMSNHPAVTVHGINLSIPPQCPYEPSLDPLLFSLSFIGTSCHLRHSRSHCSPGDPLQ